MPAPSFKTQPPVPLNYLYCDSPATYASAVWILRNAPYLILDCEGNNLGRAGGCATLICVGTPFAEHIFLFDLLSTIITPRDAYSLLQLLADPGILKVVWDGRMDYLEILSSYGIMLEGVLDLQVAEVASRTSVRGEGEPDRLDRLRRSCLSHSIVKRVEQCRELHAVIGLQRCWTDCGYDRDVGKDLMRMHKDKGCEMWLRRPLTEQLLQYAAKDILLIGVLYPHFQRSGWIPNDHTEYVRLLEQSRRYISAHREQGKSTDLDVFRPCALMPLDTLAEPLGPLHRCTACNRFLSYSAFETCEGAAPSSGSHLASSTRIALLRRPRCRLCSILALKNGLRMDDRWLVN
ncbi:hypothetical protein PHLGIDRAFT_333751 [Phlebiopsis gigantea 11061_1 CR5-6]|uniref:3'-5' exonuclease domain-containing protein n=1 Tax=Phlebiopsis gigantea (strain 11061_1 CR5-6) TaxID=745531 RepID=A0A0C3SD39_PHLG1|nr:hypothetical protein PHLGIDRAFT_333751 [Phlebiopsis gigantea 11061_1 CR5-6]